MNPESNNKIVDVMKDLVRMRDDSSLWQNLTVFLAKETTIDRKLIEPKILSQRIQSACERPKKSSNANTEARINSNKPTTELTSLDTAQIVSRNGITSSKQLPVTLEPNEKTECQPKFLIPHNVNPNQIVTNVHSSKLKLTTEERDALITRILTSELEVRRQLDYQVEELLRSSPNTSDSGIHTAQLNPPASKEKDPLMVSLLKKRLDIESGRAAQQNPTSSAKASEKTKPVDKNRPSDHTSSSRTRLIKPTKRSLTPIPEARESRGQDVDVRNVEDIRQTNRPYMESITTQERLRQQRMESELPSELIQDTSMQLHHSDDSDSLNELVIKDFPIRAVDSQSSDAAVNSLPVVEQVIIESKKLNNMIESVKERFQIKVARDKYAERRKQQIQAPNTLRTEWKEPLQTYEKIDENLNVAQSRTLPVSANILDSRSWGSVALPNPIFEQESGNTSSEEDFLSEKDMQFDDLFGTENIAEPTTLRTKGSPQKPSTTSSQHHRPILMLPDSVEKVEDLESPQLSIVSSDESVPSIQSPKLYISGTLSDYDEPPLPPYVPSEERSNSASQRSKIDIETPKKSVQETQDEKDFKRLKELLLTGVLATSLSSNQQLEGVLDLLLRQSDSLWDPIVHGIPLSSIIPSQNHEKGLLDTSVNEPNLESPLVKRPGKKLPEYMESLENEWRSNMEKNIQPADSAVDMNNNYVVPDDENVLVPGLPKYPHEPVTEFIYRKKIINIMDKDDHDYEEPDDCDDLLAENEMNFDDLTSNVAAPTYDFQIAKIMDDLEIKMEIIRKRNEMNGKSSGNLSEPRSRLGPLDEFNLNKPQFKALFGIAQNEILTDDKDVTPSQIESLHGRTPAIDDGILRNVENCQYHFERMKSIYKKIVNGLSLVKEPCSSQTLASLVAITKTFNKIRDGRICARLQSCPSVSSLTVSKEYGKGKSQRIENSSQATQTPQLTDSETQSDPVQKPVKVRKSVSFANSSQENDNKKIEASNSSPKRPQQASVQKSC